MSSSLKTQPRNDMLEGGFDTPAEGFWKKYVCGIAIPIGLAVYAIKVITVQQGTLYVPWFRRWVKIELTGRDAVILGVFYAALALFIHSQSFYRHSRRLAGLQGLAELASLLGIGVSLIWLTLIIWQETWGF